MCRSHASSFPARSATPRARCPWSDTAPGLMFCTCWSGGGSGDDASVGARRAQEAARHHAEPRANFDRVRGRGQPDRRLRQCVERGLKMVRADVRSVNEVNAPFAEDKLTIEEL